MNHQKQNWILDLVLLVGYLLTFFLDLTGVVLHQWIGVIITFLAVIHLALHWNWVKAVIMRLFNKKNGRNRLYAVIDFLLMLGMSIILVSGLLISTWLNIDLYFYGLIQDVHVWVSVIALGFTVLKIGLHWRWIVSVGQKILKPIPSKVPQSAYLPNMPISSRLKPQVDRRQFLMMMGIVTGASAVAISNVFGKSNQASYVSLEDTNSSNILSDATQSVGTEQSTAIPTAVEQSVVATEAIDTTTLEPTLEPTATTAVVVSNSSSTSCIVRCSKHCAYPGRCRRYTDTNNNGYCDNGECL